MNVYSNTMNTSYPHGAEEGRWPELLYLVSVSKSRVSYLIAQVYPERRDNPPNAAKRTRERN